MRTLPVLLAVFALPCGVSAQKVQNPAPEPFAMNKLARAGGKFGMLLRQFKADEPTLPERHEAGAKEAVAEYQGARDLPAGYWVWQKPYWFVFRDGPGTELAQRHWGPEAACGAPDTPEPGDHHSAWATKEQDEKGEWLLLEYEAPVKLVSVEVHETYNPGALASVAILLPDGEVLELWRAPEVKAAAEKGRVLQLDVPLGFQVERVLLRFDSEKVTGWNEIDAVGLKDDKGKMHWASRAVASSTYAEASEAGAGAPGGGGVPVILGGARFVPARVVPLEIELPRVVVEAPVVEFRRKVVFGAIAPDVVVGPGAGGAAGGGDAELMQMRKRVGDLEARVKELEAELAREKAAKQGK
jgi:hypothetical protein